MRQRRQTELLKEEIDSFLSPLSAFPELLGLARQSLTVSKSAASSSPTHPWHLLPLIVCESVSGSFERALPATASLSLMKAAAEIFDDLADNDSSESIPARYGFGVATNLATTLVILAEKGLTQTQRGISDDVTFKVIDTLNLYHVNACAGQHEDLRSQTRGDLDEEAYIQMIGLKSAYQLQCACHLGAIVAGADEELIRQFSEYGYNLGLASQITNDIEDVTRGNDLIVSKTTLPIIIARSFSDVETLEELNNFLDNRIEPSSRRVQELLFRTGSIHYCAIKAEYFKQVALETLTRIAKTGVKVTELRTFAA